VVRVSGRNGARSVAARKKEELPAEEIPIDIG